MSKIGRNDKCPCGSGKKYKKCCGYRLVSPSLPPEALQQVMAQMAEMQKKQIEHVQQFGHVRLPVSTVFNGQRVVAVGSRLFYSPNWKTFHDFLPAYLRTVFGPEWGEAELRKDLTQRHPVSQWYHHLCMQQQEHAKEGEQIHSFVMTGPVRAFMALGYDLYALEHHALLQQRLIERLKHVDQFQGARYETYVAATFIRAGFDLVLEDETDRDTSHCEFVAIHKQFGDKYSAEAKSRHRPGYLGQRGDPQPLEVIKADVDRLLKRALKKRADHQRIVFLDVNVPPVDHRSLDFLENIKNVVEPIKFSSQYPAALIFFTNHPQHFVDAAEQDPGHTAVFTGMNMDIFKEESRDDPFAKYPSIGALWNSVLNHTAIPANFEV